MQDKKGKIAGRSKISRMEIAGVPRIQKGKHKKRFKSLRGKTKDLED